MALSSRLLRRSLLINNFPRLLAGLLFIYFYCEYVIFFITQIQCTWPELGEVSGVKPVYAMMLTDPHLLGPHNGHWIDKWRREWQMHRAFQTAMFLHKPDVVFILGDLFEEGNKCNEKEFNEVVRKFHQLFKVPVGTSLYAVAGNHDIGFHYNEQFEREAQALGPIASDKLRRATPHLAARFERQLRAPPAQLVTLRGNHFVLLNSMALQGDGCPLCSRAEAQIDSIADILKCSSGSKLCKNKTKVEKYSRPILIQHFPLYRVSDSICTELDSDLQPGRENMFIERWDCLSKESTEFLVESLRPRRAFGGHTHYSCLVRHSFVPTSYHKIEFLEYTVPSFSWGHTLKPQYYLLTVSPEEARVAKCELPPACAPEFSAATLLALLLIFLKFYKLKRNSSKYKHLSGKKV